jgi:hypothetical protein
MTMHITPSRPSLAGINETTAIRSWQERRYGKTSIPESSIVRLEGAPTSWTVSRFGETEVTNWDVPSNSDGMGSRRIWKRSIPASSLMGIGSLGRHVETYSQRRWEINPLSGATCVENAESRRVGKQRFYNDDAWQEQASISGFGALGADLDMNVSVLDVQIALRKVGICRPGGRLMVADGKFGPITNSAMLEALRRWNQSLGAAGNIPASRAYSGTSGSREIRISSTFWAAIQAAAAGSIDQCGGGSSGGGGGSSGGGGGSSGGGGGSSGGGGGSSGGGSSGGGRGGRNPNLDIEGPWYTNPMYLIGLAALAVGGYFAYDYLTKPEEFSLPEDGWMI